jgi:hypothetical protein
MIAVRCRRRAPKHLTRTDRMPRLSRRRGPPFKHGLS